jgi:hypothetical protein
VRDDRAALGVGAFGGLPWNVQPSWNAAPPAGTSIGTSSSSAPSGSESRTWPSQSSGAWNVPPAPARGQWFEPRT